jgi:translation initiation factor IF-3
MSKTTNVTMNEAIKHETVRVLSATGEQLGVMTAKEALKLANDEDLDLIEISPNANPPVCKIVDFGKYKYELERKEKESKKKQKTVEVKEVRLSPGIGVNDIKTKLSQVRKFLEKGNKVKVVLQFHGREITHMQHSKYVIDDFIAALNDIAVAEKGVKIEGKAYSAILVRK